MIVKEDFLNNLRRFFSLNLYEVRIWTALLSRGVSTAGELSDIGNVPRSRAYDVLESLEKKGFIIMKLGKPIKYVAVEPLEVVERVKKLFSEQAKEKMKSLDVLKKTDTLKELNLLHKQGIQLVEPSDLSGAIRGRHNLYHHLEMMIRGAKKNITIMTTNKGVIRKVESLKSELDKLSRKGVKVKIAAPIDKDTEKLIKSLPKIIEVRKIDDINARFCIVDNKELMFMIMDDEEVHPTYDIGVWINTPYFASALNGLFEATWSRLPKK